MTVSFIKEIKIIFLANFLASFLLINCHKAKLLNFVNSEGIESLSKKTSPGFAPFLISEYFETKFLIDFYLEGFLVLIFNETAPFPRVFHGY